MDIRSHNKTATGDLSPENILLARKMLVASFFVSAGTYFAWRLTTFNTIYPVYSLLFYLCELVGFIWQALNLLSLMHFKPRLSPTVPQGMSVDVYIPTYNEPAEVVRRTAFAARNISYPHTTWVLDDGNRPEMRALAAELGCHYIARTDNKGAKAGNLNNAMTQTKGEFIAVLDADFIAAPEFLDRILGYFTNPRLAFVQTPQEFYNFDSYQHIGSDRENELWSEHSLFFHAQQRGRDMNNAAMYCGSSAVLRRSALDDVGGFASTTVTEDMHTSTLLHANGWESIYHPETLSAGLAPHDAASFQRQRTRWAAGAMQIARQEGLLAGGMRLTRFQRAAYLHHIGNYIEGPRHIFLYFASAVTLAFYISPLKASFAGWMVFYLPFLFLGLLAYKELSRGYAKTIKNEIFNMARCPALLRAFPALVSKKHIDFKITPKVRGAPTQFLFPWFMLAINLGAIGKSVYDQFFGTPRIDGWPILIVMMWCLLGAWLALHVCLLSRRCNSNRRSFSRFPVSIGTVLQGETAHCAATATRLSDGGITFRPDKAGTLPEGPCRCVLRVCGRDMQLNVTLRPAKAGQPSGGPLSWGGDMATRDEFIYLMMVGRIRTLDSMRFPDNMTFIAPLARLAKRFAA